MTVIQTDFSTFRRYAEGQLVIPVYGRLQGVDVSPLQAAQILSPPRPTFLLESLGPYGEFARASFLGLSPLASVVAWPGRVEIRDRVSGKTETHAVDPYEGLELLLRRYRPAGADGLGDFWGGAVGFMGYDTVRSLERLPELCPVEPDRPEMTFVVCRDLLRFDRGTHEVLIISLALPQGPQDLESAYHRAVERVEEMGRRLAEAGPAGEADTAPNFSSSGKWTSNVTKAEYLERVRRAKEYIRDGDIIQVVLSQRLESDFGGEPLGLYAVLRGINPSPYSFYLDLGDIHLVGASPEMLVRLTGEHIQVRPIAGTRPRGKDEAADKALARELLADAKETAEHIMLVDLGRNDVGRVARLGMVRVPKLMTIERYSHVMHIVSHVEGALAPGQRPLDVLRATFPAGTLSGAPKIRAMEIIEELENVRRGPYGGAVGYVSFSGDMDFCITIRTLVIEGDRAWVQAGGGIVADSDPETEYQESLNKAQAVISALAHGQKQ